MRLDGLHQLDKFLHLSRPRKQRAHCDSVIFLPKGGEGHRTWRNKAAEKIEETFRNSGGIHTGCMFGPMPLPDELFALMLGGGGHMLPQPNRPRYKSRRFRVAHLPTPLVYANAFPRGYPTSFVDQDWWRRSRKLRTPFSGGFYMWSDFKRLRIFLTTRARWVVIRDGSLC